MRRSEIRTIEDAYAYALDCNLATVSSMAMIKSRKKGEYERQIEIAQTMIDFADRLDVYCLDTRAEAVFEAGTVQKWADKHDVLKQNEGE